MFRNGRSVIRIPGIINALQSIILIGFHSLAINRLIIFRFIYIHIYIREREREIYLLNKTLGVL